MLMGLLFFASSSCFSGEIEDALNRAGLVETPTPTGDAWAAANHHLVDYVIANDAGKPAIKEVKGLRQPREIKVAFNGNTLIGENKGEWGGSLSVVNQDGTKRILIPENIVQLIQEEDELFVFTGLAHLFSAQGAIYKVTHDKAGVKAEKVTLLPGAPQVVVTERNDRGYFGFLIVTNDGLVRFTPKYLDLKVLAIDQFWSGLYPTSAQLVDNQLMIGMRSGVAVVSTAAGIPIRVKQIQYFSRKGQ
jgi:hypothetical protein